MYLVSLYFDEKSSNIMQRFINKVADKSGNKFMIEGNVPPHITITAFQEREEKRVIEEIDKVITSIKSEEITWASIGVFKSSVIFLAPILNEYLHKLSASIYEAISSVENISVSKFYMPFEWMPHTTIAKNLDRNELFLAFQELEKHFHMFNGKITKIALSKTNPHRDVKVWEIH